MKQFLDIQQILQLFLFPALILTSSSAENAAILKLNEPLKSSMTDSNPPLTILTDPNISSTAVCALIQYCPLSNRFPLERILYGKEFCYLGNQNQPPQWTGSCFDQDNAHVCYVADASPLFESKAVPFCGADKNGVWRLDRALNPWSREKFYARYGKGLSSTVDFVIALSEVESDFTCSQALKKSYCDPITSVSYIVAKVGVFAKFGGHLNTFNAENLQKLSVALTKTRANLTISYLPLIAFKNDEPTNTTGQVVFAIPTALTLDKYKLKDMLDTGFESPYKVDRLEYEVTVIEVVDTLPSRFLPAPGVPKDPKSSPDLPSPVKKGLSGGAVFGIIVLVFTVVGVVVGSVLFYRKRKYGYIIRQSVLLQ
jgi:hypothetical protein